MRFRSNRAPYMFPAWVGGHFQQMTVTEPVELWGTVVEELEDRYTIDLAFECASAGDAKIRIEWLKECMDVIEP